MEVDNELPIEIANAIDAFVSSGDRDILLTLAAAAQTGARQVVSNSVADIGQAATAQRYALSQPYVSQLHALCDPDPTDRWAPEHEEALVALVDFKLEPAQVASLQASTITPAGYTTARGVGFKHDTIVEVLNRLGSVDDCDWSNYGAILRHFAKPESAMFELVDALASIDWDAADIVQAVEFSNDTFEQLIGFLTVAPKSGRSPSLRLVGHGWTIAEVADAWSTGHFASAATVRRLVGKLDAQQSETTGDPVDLIDAVFDADDTLTAVDDAVMLVDDSVFA